MNTPEEFYPGFVSSGGFGVVPPEVLASMSGLDMLLGIISGDLPAPTISRTLSFGLAEAEEGRVVFKGMPDDDHLNPVGTIHGGWTATVMDSALACCVQSMLKQGEAMATTEFKLNLIRPITTETGEVVCEAKIVSRGRTIGVSEARLVDGRGRILAFGTETCSIFPAPGAAVK